MQNKVICAIMQPTFLPWLGYFNLISKSTDFVFLTDVQFSKQSWQVRNRIKTKSGELFLNIPVKKSSLNTDINKIKIDNSKKWKTLQIKSILQNYSKSIFFKESMEMIEEIYNYDEEYLYKFNINAIKIICRNIGIKTNFHDSSFYNLNSENKIDRLIKICNKVKAKNYLSPIGSNEYLSNHNFIEEFANNSIEFNFNLFNHPKYNQLHGDFLPYLSIIDLIFNEGFKSSKKIITG